MAAAIGAGPAGQRAVRVAHRRHRRRHDRGRGHQPRRHRRQPRRSGSAATRWTRTSSTFARREYNLFLGERTAEDIKIAIGSAYPGEWDQQRVALRGRDLLTGLPRSVEVGADQIREAIETVGPADRRHDQGHDRGDAAGARRRHHGPGHRPRRRRRAAGGPRPAGRRGDQMPVHIADDPLTCVARGTGIVLQELGNPTMDRRPRRGHLLPPPRR